ncbi:glycerol-3-phosphate dehydrogenase/oxidase [Microbacterium aurantiacum]|uniref:glycerol-3-phosphate dehydrogenase/oxidase n=1 Tax=Microbacterium aurantiacum TaxID=162393 RepID=UPI001F233079|nr:glycerol-3-phosphate dehydrogenase/oxidase [Microbacterium aurantiacum]
MSEVTPTTPESRTRDAVQAIAADPSADVIIVGGGINGIATFRDLALQGVKVILVERDDFVAGASSASSHMIHGGIRYLENGEFRLVRESVVERNALVKTAPHYVRPLPTTVPIFSTFSGILSAPLRFLTHKQGKHTERGALLIKVGLVIYDFFSRDGGAVPRHRFHGRARTLSELPALNDRVKYTATYFDASMHDPERLALDVLYDGLDAGDNARAANYLEAVGMGKGGLRVRDRVSGEEFDLTAPVIVNASGPWTDLTNEQLGKPTTYMGGTKGSHIVLDNPELLEATGGREIFFEHEDGRIVLIYPLKGRVMVGTTDLDHDMREPAVCTEDEIDYFFDLVGHVFPDIRVDREQIVYRFSGVRPLPRHDDTQPGFVSRDYRIEEAPAAGRPGTTVLSLVGGKWTTFRALGEQLSDRVLEHLGRSRTRSTQGLMIGGALGYPRTQRARSAWVSDHADGRDHARVDQLLERYGTRAAALLESLDDSDAPLASLPDYSTGEIRYLVETEYVVHLIDVLLRRTSVAFVGKTSLPALRELADVAGDVLGWDAATRDEEVAETARILRERHGVELSEDSVLA